MTFRCIVDGKWPPTIEWRKDGHLLDNGWLDEIEVEPVEELGPNNLIDISSDGSVLNISSVDPAATGWYSCEARNSEGRISSSGKLDVIGKTCDVYKLYRHLKYPPLQLEPAVCLMIAQLSLLWVQLPRSHVALLAYRCLPQVGREMACR